MRKIKKFAKRLLLFFSNKIILRNLLGIIIFVFFSAYVALWVLDIYTGNGNWVEVDNFVDLDYDEAVLLAEKNDFTLFVNDSIFLEDRDFNLVLNQNPNPGSRVKKGRTIYVTITKKVPDLVVLPSLGGGNDDYDQYSSKLNVRGLHTKIKSKVSNFKYSENTIISLYFNGKSYSYKDLKQKIQVPKGSTIECVVTTKSVSSVELPDLKCKTLEEARFLLENYELKLGKIDKEDNVTDLKRAFVIGQTPAFSAGKKVAVNSSVSIKLSVVNPCK